MANLGQQQHEPTKGGLSEAKDDIAYVLRRVGSDPVFAYHTLHTESLARLCNAYAILTGKTKDEVLAEVEHNASASTETPRCERDRDALESIASAIQELPASRQPENVVAILRDCGSW